MLVAAADKLGLARTYPNIRFVLSHAGGFVPYASHHMAVAIAGDTGRSPLDVLDDFRAFYFDTALSSSPAALPTLLALARPGHVFFGSNWPFAPAPAGQYFAGGLDTGVDPDLLQAVNRGNTEALFPRLTAARRPPRLQARPTRHRLSKVPKTSPTRNPVDSTSARATRWGFRAVEGALGWVMNCRQSSPKTRCCVAPHGTCLPLGWSLSARASR